MILLPRGWDGAAELEVKRSVFRARLVRADDEAAARAVVAEARREHPEARHHCSAFVLASEGAQPVERSSDDGEPAGTGGMPILAALRGAGLVDAVCVVTRWFGGVKLGAGPLARAYGDVAGLAVRDAPRVERVERPQWRIEVSYADVGRLVTELNSRGFTVASEYGDAPSLLITGDDTDVPGLVASLTQGAAQAWSAGTVGIEIPAS